MQQLINDLMNKNNEIDKLITDFRAKIVGIEQLLDDVIVDQVLQEIFKKMSSELDFRTIAENILNMQPDSCNLRKQNMTRADKLQSVKIFVESISKADQVDNLTSPTFFTPPLEKGQMVLVNFSGIGGELNRVHYGIVWNVAAEMDCIQILPVKSDKIHYKEFEHAFSIGKVGHLSKETWIDVREIMTISRKRINTNLLESSPGAGDAREVYLNPSQEYRINDGLRVYWGKQRNLLSFILSNNKSRLPIIRDYSQQYNHFLRPVKYFKTDSARITSEYQLIDDTTTFYIDWRVPSRSLGQGQRNREVKKFAYPVPINTRGTRVDRETIRNNQYGNLQSI